MPGVRASLGVCALLLAVPAVGNITVGGEGCDSAADFIRQWCGERTMPSLWRAVR